MLQLRIMFCIIVALGLSQLLVHVDAFAGSCQPLAPRTAAFGVLANRVGTTIGSTGNDNTSNNAANSRSVALRMADDGDKRSVTARKEFGYDEGSAKFRLADDGDGDECDPEDEFCSTDKKTGNLIKLTVEEKERIFLDALQVRPPPLRRTIFWRLYQ